MFKHLALAATIAATLGSAGPASAGTEDFIGEIMMFGGTFCPRGFVKANGDLYPIVENQALFSLYGTIHGGDGRTTFGLPDLMQYAPEGILYCVAEVGIFPSRN